MPKEELTRIQMIDKIRELEPKYRESSIIFTYTIPRLKSILTMLENTKDKKITRKEVIRQLSELKDKVNKEIQQYNNTSYDAVIALEIAIKCVRNNYEV